MAVIFETERLIAREWSLDDAEAAFLIYGDPLVWQYLPGGQPDLRIEETRTRLERRIALYDEMPGFGVWTLIERDTGELVGTILLLRLDNTDEYEVGYHLRRDRWGQGYATEAAAGAIAYGFDKMGLTRVVGVTDPENIASQRVLEKCGLVRDGERFHFGMTVAYFALDKPE
jgi:RimJ/RimL family protein N-acetyltransferase